MSGVPVFVALTRGDGGDSVAWTSIRGVFGSMAQAVDHLVSVGADEHGGCHVVEKWTGPEREGVWGPAWCAEDPWTPAWVNRATGEVFDPEPRTRYVVALRSGHGQNIEPIAQFLDRDGVKAAADWAMRMTAWHSGVEDVVAVEVVGSEVRRAWTMLEPSGPGTGVVFVKATA